MIKVLLLDFSRTLLFPKDRNYAGGLNGLYKKIQENQNYKFLEHFELNTEFLDYLKTVKNKVDLFIFTSESVQDDPVIKNDLEKIFTKIFSAKQMGISKKEPKAYLLIATELNVDPNEILFIDDSSENLEAAKRSGLQTLHYKDNSTIEELMLILKT